MHILIIPKNIVFKNIECVLSISTILFEPLHIHGTRVAMATGVLLQHLLNRKDIKRVEYSFRFTTHEREDGTSTVKFSLYPRHV